MDLDTSEFLHCSNFGHWSLLFSEMQKEEAEFLNNLDTKLNKSE